MGIVSIGGGSGFVRSVTWEGAELCEAIDGEGSENGDLIFLGNGAKPRT